MRPVQVATRAPLEATSHLLWKSKSALWWHHIHRHWVDLRATGYTVQPLASKESWQIFAYAFSFVFILSSSLWNSTLNRKAWKRRKQLEKPRREDAHSLGNYYTDE